MVYCKSKRRIFVLVVLLILLLSFVFSSFTAMANSNNILDYDNNGNVSSLVYPTNGSGYVFNYRRRGTSVGLNWDSSYLTNVPGGYSGGYFGWGSNEAKYEIWAPITETNYSLFKNTIITNRFTFEFPYLNNYGNLSNSIPFYESYYKDMMYPLCTGISIPFACYGYGFDWNKVDGSQLFDLYMKFYSVDVYVNGYSVDYDENGDEILLSKWYRFNFDSSVLSEVKDRDNLYIQDNLKYANNVNLSLSFGRPLCIQTIVIDLRIKLNCNNSLSSFYSDLPLYVKDELSGCRFFVVFPAYFVLSGYSTAYNYSLFNSMGLADEVSGSIVNDSSLTEIYSKYSSAPFGSFKDVVLDNQQAFVVVGNIVNDIFSSKLVSGIVISACALSVLAAFIGLGLRIANTRSTDVKNERRYIERRDEARRYNAERERIREARREERYRNRRK